MKAKRITLTLDFATSVPPIVKRAIGLRLNNNIGYVKATVKGYIFKIIPIEMTIHFDTTQGADECEKSIS